MRSDPSSPAGRRVVAVGGTRTVPAPDAVAADYLRLVLRLDQRLPGLLDSYVGPADLKAQVDIEQWPAAARLREDAADLRERVAVEVADADRRAWFEAQLVALEAHAAALAGEALPYAAYVTACMGFAPRRRSDAEVAAARRAVEDALPGPGPLAERLAAWERDLVIPAERLPTIIDHLVPRFRGVAGEVLGLPDGEAVRVSLVRDKPWSGYAWFDGAGRSRVAINTDVPPHVPGLVRTLAHETYPGHHLEHAWKEAEVIERLGRAEATALLVNAPECPISEGLADVGVDIAVPPSDRAGLFAEVLELAGLPAAGDAVAQRELAEQAATLVPVRERLRACDAMAAWLLHEDGRPRDEVLAYLEEVVGLSPGRAAQRLDFFEHPLWRTYGFVYADGEALVRRWVDALPDERTARFGRLLREQLTPVLLLADLDRATTPG